MFSQRSNQDEIMDDLSIEGDVISKTLKELEIINKWLGGNDIILNGLNRLLKDLPAGETLTIADLGCGGGDILKVVAKWAKKKKVKVTLLGIDANPHIIAYARENTKAFPEITFQAINIFSREFAEQKFDVITCTLFCHHFDDETLTNLFSQLKTQAAKGIIINDLHRHWIAYYFINWTTAIFSKSYMVKNDAKLSVLRAFSKKELENILKNARVEKYTMSWKWAFRFQILIWIHQTKGGEKV